MISHLLFDFFGTLVEYSPSRTEHGFHASHELLRNAGSKLEYEAFLDLWDEVFAKLESSAKRTRCEFSMLEVGRVFLSQAIETSWDDAVLSQFIGEYMKEWNRGVRYFSGLPEMLARLAERYSLAIISNTHEPQLVPDHLARMGVANLFCPVVMSVELGVRKPAAAIFEHALERLDVKAECCIYVGDNHDADYLGALEAGLHPLLIDKDMRFEIAPERRLRDIFELELRVQDTR